MLSLATLVMAVQALSAAPTRGGLLPAPSGREGFDVSTVGINYADIRASDARLTAESQPSSERMNRLLRAVHPHGQPRCAMARTVAAPGTV